MLKLVPVASTKRKIRFGGFFFWWIYMRLFLRKTTEAGVYAEGSRAGRNNAYNATTASQALLARRDFLYKAMENRDFACERCD